MKMMAMIGFIMIAASGFAEVMKATGEVQTLVKPRRRGSVTAGHRRVVDVAGGAAGDHGHRFVVFHRADLAAIFVPLCVQLGFSPLAIVCIVGTAGRWAMPVRRPRTPPWARPPA
jgi:predicted histidine transporter YuiF (NhaC family)